MKLYIVTETSNENNMFMRSWVCLTKETAIECLKHRYELACMFNKEAKVENPVDTLEYGFFYWELKDLTLRYNIVESQTY